MKDIRIYLLFLFTFSCLTKIYGQTDSLFARIVILEEQFVVNENSQLDPKKKKKKNKDTFFIGENYKWLPSIGITFHKNAVSGEIGVINAYRWSGSDTSGFNNFWTLSGIKISTEFAFKERFYIAPKIGYEYDFFFFTGRLSLTNYTDFKRYEPKITPEIGIALGSVINFTYGYNIPLTKRYIENIPLHRFTLSFNIPLSGF